jgi:hypothetical protein
MLTGVNGAAERTVQTEKTAQRDVARSAAVWAKGIRPVDRDKQMKHRHISIRRVFSGGGGTG